MNRFQKVANKIRFHFPTNLPRGMTEFNKFTSDILETYDLPDMPSYRQAVASQIMHLPQLCTRKAKRHFAKSIYKAMANEIAYGAIQSIRAEAKKAEDESKALSETSA